jgi:hypothetical protein
MNPRKNPFSPPSNDNPELSPDSKRVIEIGPKKKHDTENEVNLAKRVGCLSRTREIEKRKVEEIERESRREGGGMEDEEKRQFGF